jgi:hypothetical protein
MGKDMDEAIGLKTRFRGVPWPLRGGVLLSFALSVGALVLYMAGNIPERGFSDETQFLLLRVMQYLALFLIVFSLCALGFSVRLLVRKPRFRHVLGMGLYFLTGILGVLMVVFNSFIVVAARGNG